MVDRPPAALPWTGLRRTTRLADHAKSVKSRFWVEAMNITLVANRLADMLVCHPAQDNSRVCSRCGERVGIYPSGQKALRAHPTAVILCHQCAVETHDGFAVPIPAGPWDEILQEMRDSKDVPRE